MFRVATRVLSRAALNSAKRPLSVALQQQTIQSTFTKISTRTLSTTNFRLGSVDPSTMVEIEERVMTVLNCYDKIDPNVLTMTSHFLKDLNLDSLDHVELIVALENEFSVEVADGDEETLMTPREVCEYLADLWDVSE